MSRRTKPTVIAERVAPEVDSLMRRMKRLESFKHDAEQVICALYDRLKAVEAAARPKGS